MSDSREQCPTCQGTGNIVTAEWSNVGLFKAGKMIPSAPKFCPTCDGKGHTTEVSAVPSNQKDSSLSPSLSAREWAERLVINLQVANHNDWTLEQRVDYVLKALLQPPAMTREAEAAESQVSALQSQLERVREEEREHILEGFLEWRNVEEACKVCSGSGVKAYANTTTWRGGFGGQMITNDVCDSCWGSGDANRKWTDLRKLAALRDPGGEK